MANAPRPDGTLDFHIRLIDGGAVSMALTDPGAVGARLRIGPPAGVLRLDTASRRDVLMVAGSTGLAPLKAMLEQLAALPEPPGRTCSSGRGRRTDCMTCRAWRSSRPGAGG